MSIGGCGLWLLYHLWHYHMQTKKGILYVQNVKNIHSQSCGQYEQYNTPYAMCNLVQQTFKFTFLPFLRISA